MVEVAVDLLVARTQPLPEFFSLLLTEGLAGER